MANDASANRRQFVILNRLRKLDVGTIIDENGQPISDVYNGDSETYSSLRAAAFVMGQMVYVPEQEFGF